MGAIEDLVRGLRITREESEKYIKIKSVVELRLKDRDSRGEADERQDDIDGYDLSCLEEIIEIVRR